MRIFDRMQGDPAIKITENGSTMKFINGQPIMDQGLENAFIISLFTKPGWWGNALLKKDTQKIGSDFEEVRTVIDVQTINDYRSAAQRATDWAKEVNLASEIDVTVTNPSIDRIKTQINVKPPGSDIREFLFFKNGLNWLSQAINPAHERF